MALERYQEEEMKEVEEIVRIANEGSHQASACSEEMEVEKERCEGQVA